MTVLMAFTRWAHLLALMTVFGGSAFLALLKRRKLAREDAIEPLRVPAAVVALVSAIMQVPLTAAGMTGGWRGGMDPDALLAVVRYSQFGRVFAFRAVVLSGLCVFAIWSQTRHTYLAVLSGLGLLCVAFTGHVAASGAVHMLAAGLWLGGLILILRLFLDSHESPATMVAPVRLFSEWGTYLVAVLVLAGGINVGVILANERIGEQYAIVLATKIVLAAAMVGLAILNRWRFLPALERHRNEFALARSIHIEIALGVLIVGLAAVLGSISPG
jgi:putative copper resistance protein D